MKYLQKVPLIAILGLFCFHLNCTKSILGFSCVTSNYSLGFECDRWNTSCCHHIICSLPGSKNWCYTQWSVIHLHLQCVYHCHKTISVILTQEILIISLQVTPYQKVGRSCHGFGMFTLILKTTRTHMISIHPDGM